jgi:hypothetical protein
VLDVGIDSFHLPEELMKRWQVEWMSTGYDCNF